MENNWSIKSDSNHATAAMTDYDATIDWDRYWGEADEQDRGDASPTTKLAADPLLAFLEKTGAPASYADVGCGPGGAVFAVAEAYPEATVVGYDAAEPVLTENRGRARERGSDVDFERGVLPGFDPGRTFDVVSSLFTLCYVPEIERAIQSLYDAVASGGYLLIQYHNRLAQAHYRKIAASPDEYLDESSVWDPDQFADRFELTIEGENLLSYERIQEVLGTWPRSVFSVAENAEQYAAHRYEPLVYVPK